MREQDTVMRGKENNRRNRDKNDAPKHDLM